MKKLGLIGGIGPESTVAYYRQIVHGVQKQKGPHVLPMLSIESLSAFEVFAFCREQRYDDLARYVLQGIRNLASGGAELVALTGNTPNIVFEQLKEGSPIPIVSAIEACRDVAVQRGLQRVGLLGTVFTMTNDFFKRPLERSGVNVTVPRADEIAFIQQKIESELEHGIIKDDTRDQFIAIIRRLKEEAGIQQVVLGCTELPLLLSDETSPVPCLDTMSIHVAALLQAIGE